MNKEPNKLIHASSPYLLQHAYNPVHWQEWGPEPLQQAKSENKLILVSIGYSACHWCHVMEHESFENFEVAEIMNAHFVCIKIDREERPDIDQIYMLAVQLMGQNGGWPLNCICLPDQRPIYGGTYYKKEDWINILESVAKYWKQQPEKAIEYASKLELGIKQAEKPIVNLQKPDFSKVDLDEIIAPWKRTFDMTEGGYNRAPKFPLPNNWDFLLKAGFLLNDESLIVATLFTLEKMAMGGIYDQIGGGFSRYAVDDKWKIPHFEKMLYDNAQLIGLYAEAWQFSGNDFFKKIAEESISWIEKEMTSPEGLFYAALDADSEGVEGKFYVWDYSEFRNLLGSDADLMCAYYNLTEQGNWDEEETNVLLKKVDDNTFAQQHNISLEDLQYVIERSNETLKLARESRVKPGLDDKCITAWNGLMIQSYAKCSLIFGKDSYYKNASSAMDFLLENCCKEEVNLFRIYKNGKASIPAFLDDYATIIDALIALYEVHFEEKWLQKARMLTCFVLDNFKDQESPFLFYTSVKGEELIARKHEIMDNVIPSANSIMAQNLQKLGLLFDEPIFIRKAEDLLQAVAPQIKKYPSAYSNWSIQMLYAVFGIHEIALIGKDHERFKKEFCIRYIPNKIFLGGTNSTLPLLENKTGSDSKIYICKNKTCSLPTDNVADALILIS